jgi:hypothetical protein
MHALRVAENGEGEYLEGNTGRERERFIKQRNIFIITCRRFSKLKVNSKNQNVHKTSVI